MTQVLAIIVTVLLSGEGWAAVLEVGAGQTYTTIAACHTAAIAGDTCNIHAGSYAETVTVTKSITFRNHTGESPVLTGSFSLGATANVTITCNNGGGAMEITGYGTPSVSDEGIHQSGGTGLTVTGCRIHDGYGPSIYSRNSTKLILDGNHTYNNLSAAAGTSATGITIVSGHSTDNTYANGILIANNVSHDNAIDGMTIHGQYFIVSGNNIYNNITADWATTHPDGIQFIKSLVDGYQDVQHARVYNNTIRNHTQNIFVEGTAMPDGSGAGIDDIWIWNNVIYSESATINGVVMDSLATKGIIVAAGKNVSIFNNYIGRHGNGALVIQNAGGGYDTTDNSIVIKNNILNNSLAYGAYILKSTYIASGQLNYNLYNNATSQITWVATSYATLATFQSAVPTQEVNGVAGDPLVNSLPTPTLQTGSPAINAGVDVSGVCALCVTDKSGVTRPQGAAWDMGAYELATSVYHHVRGGGRFSGGMRMP